MTQVAIALNYLCAAQTTEDELYALQKLNSILSNTNCHDDPENIESNFLSQSKVVLEEGNPYPQFKVTDLRFPDTVSLHDFTNYLLTRRYGWSETMPYDGTMKVQRIYGVGSSSFEEALMKSKLNELLDEFLKWLLCQQLSHELLSSLKFSVHQASNHPVIRKQTFLHILEWFRSKCTVFHEEFFQKSKELIILGLTDIWSAIRSACAQKLHIIVEQFNFEQLEDFFQSLVSICQTDSTTWQAREGAVMGFNAIIRRFQWVGFNQDLTEHDHVNTEYFLKFGKEELQKIPEFISTQLSDVIYLLLADPQLSIREQSIKAFSSYLSRCEFQEALTSFKEVVTRLCEATGFTVDDMLKLNSDDNKLNKKIQWMDAYLAEGLLGMSIFLVKLIPTEYLLPGWSLCCNTMLFYLMHPASTVRQATSKAIKFLVAKDTSNPLILKLVFSSLIMFWDLDKSAMNKSCLPSNYTDLPEEPKVYLCENAVRNPSISTIDMIESLTWSELATELSATWEWREGRLLAYELIFQFLIKNHWLYTFGTASSSKMGTANGDEKSSSIKGNLRPLQTYGGSALQGARCESAAASYKDRHGDCASPDSPREVLLRPRSPMVTMRLHTPHSPQLRPRNGLEVGKFRVGPPVRVPLRRRATMDHVNVSSLKTLVKHYTYYEKTTTPTKTSKDRKNKVNAMPLMEAIKYLETVPSAMSAGGERLSGSFSNQTTDSNLIKSPLVSPSLDTDKMFNQSQDEKFASQLLELLYQTIECIDSGSWELRRMSQQVLPCLDEVIRWYDMDILVKFWSEHLVVETNVLCFGAAQTFLHSLTHAMKLSSLLSDPPDSWQNVEACKTIVRRIVDSVRGQLPLYIPVFMGIIKRYAVDKLTVIAIQVLFTAAMFNHPQTSLGENDLMEGVSTAINCIEFIASICNPTSRISKRASSHSAGCIQLAGSGFLSANPLDSDQLAVTIEHLEKYLIEHTHNLIVQFIRQQDPSITCLLLPSLSLYLRKQVSSDQILKAVTESITFLLENLSERANRTLDDNTEEKTLYELKNDCFFELLLCLTDQPTKHILHAGLECLIVMFQHRDSSRFILPIIKTVCNQLSSGHEPSCKFRIDTSHLEILSNDIRQSEEAQAVEYSDTDDEDALNVSDHMESLALHSSSGGGTASGRQSALSQHSTGDGMSTQASHHSEDNEDSSSDWDSWDDSEDEVNDAEIAFKEFLKKMYATLQAQGRSGEFSTCLGKLTAKEQQLIKGLLRNRNK